MAFFLFLSFLLGIRPTVLPLYTCVLLLVAFMVLAACDMATNRIWVLSCNCCQMAKLVFIY